MPEGVIPEGVTPEWVIPEGVILEGEILEGLIPEGPILEGEIPEGVPEGPIPEKVIPEGAIPEGVMPEGVTPVGGILEGVIPEGVIPEGVIPEGPILEGAIPEGPIPEGVIPEGLISEGPASPLTPTTVAATHTRFPLGRRHWSSIASPFCGRRGASPPVRNPPPQINCTSSASKFESMPEGKLSTGVKALTPGSYLNPRLTLNTSVGADASPPSVLWTEEPDEARGERTERTQRAPIR